MEKETTDILFDISQKLLEIMSLTRANPVLDNLPELCGLQELYDEADEKWRELMKAKN